ncbi:MAG: AMP-binding protein, partial [Rhizobiales bacterium]|nr:AMP-binding protein [Hyphomicrobiales bacterium]
LFQYIGELCRYLVNAPVSDDERRHSIRIACGNGLRPDIWRAFDERFQIPRIIEFYGATEGNVVLVNFDGREGAIGRLPSWLRLIFKIALVRHDGAGAEPERDAQGHCIPCKPGEIGEALGSIERNPKRPTNRFDGYVDENATESKILRNVFKDGDMWFRTGDLMRKDRYGYFYFVDRIGDTFRWKGENVSTTEVAAIISAVEGIAEANVYGVMVPGHEGRAGMAKIVPHQTAPDLGALAGHLATNLPDYARPVFLRFGDEIEKTSTFKQRKQDSTEDGFNPAATSDQLYYADALTGEFRILDQHTYERICTGDIKI